jgi:hypothetical protein
MADIKHIACLFACLCVLDIIGTHLWLYPAMRACPRESQLSRIGIFATDFLIALWWFTGFLPFLIVHLVPDMQGNRIKEWHYVLTLFAVLLVGSLVRHWQLISSAMACV